MSHYYLVHGLTCESAIELPDLAPAASGAADVEIIVDPPRISLADVREPVEDGFAAFTISGVARYEIHEGRRIVVQPVVGADIRDVRLFLLGSATGLLLHQRGLFALHAAAGVFDGVAVAITGPSGAGKSTLARALEARGVPVLSDDLLVIREQAGRMVADRAVRRIRLCPDAITAHGDVPGAFPLSYAPEKDRTKHDVSLRDAPPSAPLVAVVELVDGTPSFDRLEGVEAVECLMANSFRGTMLSAGRQRSDHFRTCLHIARCCAVYRMSRSKDFSTIAAQVEQLAEVARRRS